METVMEYKINVVCGLSNSITMLFSITLSNAEVQKICSKETHRRPDKSKLVESLKFRGVTHANFRCGQLPILASINQVTTRVSSY